MCSFNSVAKKKTRENIIIRLSRHIVIIQCLNIEVKANSCNIKKYVLCSNDWILRPRWIFCFFDNINDVFLFFFFIISMTWSSDILQLTVCTYSTDCIDLCEENYVAWYGIFYLCLSGFVHVYVCVVMKRPLYITTICPFSLVQPSPLAFVASSPPRLFFCVGEC